MTAPVLLVRLRRGVVGESLRVVHVVPCPNGDQAPAELVAYCGTGIAPGVAELLDEPSGMPCTACLLTAPLPAPSELPEAEVIHADRRRVADVESRPRRPITLLPLEEYVASLPRKRMAAGVLFRDEQGRVLLLETSYKTNWEIPGGVVDADESPWGCAARETREELGIDRPLGRLLVIDYMAADGVFPEGIAFVFDGGILSDADAADIVLDGGEILSAGFHTVAQARQHLEVVLAARIEVALQAAEQGVTALCENGRRVA